MANVRCPMCSKINPPEAETCGYCGARLKPVRPPSESAASPTPASPKPPSGDNEPDWLLSLRSDEPSASTDKGPAAPGAAGDENGDASDWLSRIRQRARAETSAPQDLFGQEKEEPDWMTGSAQEPSADQGGDLLDRLKPGANQPSAGGKPASGGMTSAGGAADGLDMQDWLRGLSNEPAGQSGRGPAAPSNQPAGSEDDWMSHLADWQAGATAEPPAGQEPPATGEAQDDLSWLNTLGEGSAAPGPEAGSADSGGFDLSGFLSNLEQPSAPSSQPAQDTGRVSSGFGLTGFLSNLEKHQLGLEPESQPEPSHDSQPSQPEEGGLQWEQPGQQEDQRDLSGFLSSLGAPAAPETGEYTENTWDQGASAAPTEGMPDWLSGASTPEAEAPATSEQSAEQANLPDWLRELEAEAAQMEQPKEPAGQKPAAPPSVAPPVEPTASQTSLPDWLQGAEPSSAAAEPPAQEPPDDNAGLPSWLAGLQESQPPAEQAPSEAFESADLAEESQAALTAGAEGLPDWFNQLEAPDIEKTQPRRTGELKTEKEPQQPSVAASASTGDDSVPDWLREFNAPAGGEENGISFPALVGAEEPAAPPAGEGDQPFAVELPDWLEEDAAARSLAAQAADVNALMPSEETPAEGGSENLAQAELPEWVKEMRPIESIIPGEVQMAEADQRVEKAGPLAGMRGVLPAEDLVTRFRKPPIYSVKLRVTEKQKSQASIFDSILAQESQPLLIPPVRSHAPGVLLRVIIALVLIAALAFPIFLGGGFAPLAMPALYPSELLNMFDRIDQGTSSTTPVLLAVDYEPGLSGEMRLASSAVIDHLVKKNVPIVVISTVPTGPALANQLLSQAQSGNAQYDLAQKTVNLGYLPGGTISLLEFAQQPQLAAPVTLAGNLAWQETFLKDISGVSGFSQIIVLTDRAETGRSWVEQVQPYIGSIPLFMVTSAQAAPLLYPYVEGGQISGMVSGLLGGAMYAQRAGQTGNEAANNLAAYQVGVTLALLVVVIGGLISGGMVLFKRGEKDEE